MRIPEKLASEGLHFSFEFFPPKQGNQADALFDTVSSLNDLCPEFCSVTWGAGGSSVRNSLDIVDHLQNKMNIPTVAHFTGLGMTRETVDHMLQEFADRNVFNILALRGDKPHSTDIGAVGGFKYASELVRYIRDKEADYKHRFSLLVAGCPEGHPESPSFEDYMQHLADKVNMGADGIVTQFFFDNNKYLVFRDELKSRGVRVPVSIGVMIVTKASMIKRMVELSGCSVPPVLRAAIEKYEKDDVSMMKWGIDFAAQQIADLISGGERNFHIYTLNRSRPTRQLMDRVRREL